MAKALLLLTLLGTSFVGASSSGTVENANPIRKIVTLLQDMRSEISSEHEKEKELYDKFMCWCETTDQELKQQAASASSKIDDAQAKLDEDTSSKSAINQELSQHKLDRSGAQNELQKATAIRNKEAEEFEEANEDAKRNVASLASAIPALEKGMGAGALLQTPGGDQLKRLVQTSAALSTFDRENVVAFLEQRANGDYVPQSGQIVGILKTMQDDMQKSLEQSEADEKSSAAAYLDLKTAKNKEIAVASTAIESKQSQSGELAVLIVQSKDTLADTEAELADATKYISSLGTQCMDKQKEWTARQAMRTQEVSAISEAITMLNDDDALDIFKKAAPSSLLSVRPSSWGFLQSRRAKEMPLVKAHAILENAAMTYRSKPLELLSYTLASKLRQNQKTQNFDLINGLLDKMVAHLQREGGDDEKHKEYCEAEFQKAADNGQSVQENLNAQSNAITELKDQVDTMGGEISTLEAEIQALDGSVAAASLQRKKESAEYTQMMTLNEAALQLIDKAKSRLAKFYSPALYKAEPKKELAADDRIMSNLGYATAEEPAGLVQVRIRNHGHSRLAPPIPPETFGAYTKKGEKSTGVTALMDMLAKELRDDMAAAEHDEKVSAQEYQDLMTTSAETRSQNAKSITNKEAAKATVEGKLVEAKDSKMLTAEELEQVREFVGTLHQSCDFVMENFDLRKEARANEMESLKNAKSVLAGATFD